MRYALTYAHVSSNIGDVALNAGFAAALEGVAGVSVEPVLVRAPAGTLAAVGDTFPGLDDSPFRLADSDLTLDRMAHYCVHPEHYFEDLGLADVEGIVLHAGEHLYSPPHLNQLHPLALWRVLPLLAAQATGRRSVVLPSTFGPFRSPDLLSEVISDALQHVDALACRDARSVEVLREATGIEARLLLDPAFFLSAGAPAGKAVPKSIGMTMRLENAGLRAGDVASRSYLEQVSKGDFRTSESAEFSIRLIESIMATDSSAVVDLYVQGRADEQLHAALAEHTHREFGDRVRLQRPQSLTDYRSMLRSNDAVVAARFHACILAMAQYVPAYGIHMPSHGHKMLGLFDQLGAPDRVATLLPENVDEIVGRVAYQLAQPTTGPWEHMDALREESATWLAESLTEGSRSHSATDTSAMARLGALAEVAQQAYLSSGATPRKKMFSSRVRKAITARPLQDYYRLKSGEPTRKRVNELKVAPELSQVFGSPEEVKPAALHSWEPLIAVLSNSDVQTEQERIEWSVAYAQRWCSEYLDTKANENVWTPALVVPRLHRLTYLVDLVARSSLSRATFGELWSHLRKHVEVVNGDDFFEPAKDVAFNTVIVQLELASRFRNIEWMRKQGARAADRLEHFIETRFSSDGIYLQHSPGLHAVWASSVRALVQRYPQYLHPLRSRAALIEDALAHFVAPDLTLATLGDTDQTVIDPVDSYLGRKLKSVATRGRAGTSVEPTLADFLDSGYWCVRNEQANYGGSDSSFLVQTAAFHSRAHKHADDLSFIWWERGQEVLIDPGRFGYGPRLPESDPLWSEGFYYSDPERLYVESTRAHNTVEIDGKSTLRRGVRPPGSMLSASGSSEGVHWSHATVTREASVTQSRVIAYLPGQWLAILDEVTDPVNPHTARQYFHFAPELDVQPEAGGYRISSAKWSQPLNMAASQGAVPLPVWRGSSDPMMGWVSRKPRKLEPSPSTGFELAAGREVAVATVFAFGEVEQPTIDTASKEISFAVDGSSWRLSFESDRSRALNLVVTVQE